MTIITTLLQSILIVIFLLSGIGKIYGLPMHVENFKKLLLPQWFRVVTGIVQVIGTAGLIAGFLNMKWAAMAGLWLTFTMIGAIIAHVRVKDTFKQTVPAIVLVCLLGLLLSQVGNIF